jgi:hypothetical protein
MYLLSMFLFLCLSFSDLFYLLAKCRGLLLLPTTLSHTQNSLSLSHTTHTHTTHTHTHTHTHTTHTHTQHTHNITRTHTHTTHTQHNTHTTHTHTHSLTHSLTLGRTPLDMWLVHCRDFFIFHLIEIWLVIKLIAIFFLLLFSFWLWLYS